MVKDVPAEVVMERIQEISEMWQRYIKLIDQGTEAEANSPELEQEFRQLSVELTLKAQFLSMAVPEGMFDLWKDMRKLIAEIPSIEILRTEPPIRVSAFRNLWHEVSIALNQKVGHIRHYYEEKSSGKRK